MCIHHKNAYKPRVPQSIPAHFQAFQRQFLMGSFTFMAFIPSDREGSEGRWPWHWETEALRSQHLVGAVGYSGLIFLSWICIIFQEAPRLRNMHPQHKPYCIWSEMLQLLWWPNEAFWKAPKGLPKMIIEKRGKLAQHFVFDELFCRSPLWQQWRF